MCSSFDLFTDIDNAMVIVSEPMVASSVAPGLALRPLTDSDAYFDLRVFWRDNDADPVLAQFMEGLTRLITGTDTAAEYDSKR